MKNLHTKVHALDQEQTRQQELIYSAEFQIQQMERKVARGMGERTDQEKQNLNTKIQQLEVRASCWEWRGWWWWWWLRWCFITQYYS